MNSNKEIQKLLDQCDLSQRLLVERVVNILQDEISKIENEKKKLDKRKHFMDAWGDYLFKYLKPRLENIGYIGTDFHELKKHFEANVYGK